MMKKRIIIGLLIILTGVLTAAYPWLKAAYFEHGKNKALEQWVLMSTARETVSIAKMPDANIPVLESEPRYTPLDENVWAEDTSVPFDTDYVLKNTEGIITIDNLNLRYPILRGATKYNLNFSVCAVMGSPEIGGEGNYCVAGHNSRIYGRQFNRLTELKEGDIVSLSDGANSFDYIAIQTSRVSPEDTWVLEDAIGKRNLTLITCDYTLQPTGRFIVRCELMEGQSSVY